MFKLFKFLLSLLLFINLRSAIFNSVIQQGNKKHLDEKIKNNNAIYEALKEQLMVDNVTYQKLVQALSKLDKITKPNLDKIAITLCFKQGYSNVALEDSTKLARQNTKLLSNNYFQQSIIELLSKTQLEKLVTIMGALVQPPLENKNGENDSNIQKLFITSRALTSLIKSQKNTDTDIIYNSKLVAIGKAIYSSNVTDALVANFLAKKLLTLPKDTNFAEITKTYLIIFQSFKFNIADIAKIDSQDLAKLNIIAKQILTKGLLNNLVNLDNKKKLSYKFLEALLKRMPEDGQYTDQQIIDTAKDFGYKSSFFTRVLAKFGLLSTFNIKPKLKIDTTKIVVPVDQNDPEKTIVDI